VCWSVGVLTKIICTIKTDGELPLKQRSEVRIDRSFLSDYTPCETQCFPPQKDGVHGMLWLHLFFYRFQ